MITPRHHVNCLRLVVDCRAVARACAKTHRADARVLAALKVRAVYGMAAHGELVTHRIRPCRGPAVPVVCPALARDVDDDEVVAALRLVENALDSARRCRDTEVILRCRISEACAGIDANAERRVVGIPLELVQSAAVTREKRAYRAMRRDARRVGLLEDVARPAWPAGPHRGDED